MKSAIVLAAGMSTRMKKNKLLLPFKEKTVIETVLDTLVNSQLDEIIVVTGHQRELIEPLLAPYSVKIVYNSAYKMGQSTSVKLGLSSISPISDAAIFIMGDQPMVTHTDINNLISQVSADTSIIVPKNDERFGSPVSFYKTWFDQLRNVTGDQGGRMLLKKYPHAVTYVMVDTPYFFDDVDNEVSYETLLNSIELI